MHITLRMQMIAHGDSQVIHWAPALPKTRSGKIMRRILKKIAEGKDEDLGDTSTLADPAVVDALIRDRPAKAAKKDAKSKK
mmetsp:Transcript_3580/g.10411  ORF Transcript_3580/g.10411 Transcript_3580/m.10411 type:complete len:81 (-) Transcript_3580:657-899(-)